MAWDAKSLDELSEVSPFVSGSRTRPMQKFADPLAASTAFAAREDYVFPTQELEDEEVIEKLPGYALEETLRSIHDEPIAAHETFEVESALESYESAVGDEAFSGPEEENEDAKTTAFLKLVADEAVKWNFIPAAVGTEIKNGERDEVTLTDKLFFPRHPELPAHYKIKLPGDKALSEEWKALRATVHRILRAPADGIVVAPAFVKPSSPPIPPKTEFSDCLKAHVPSPLHVSVMDLTDPHSFACGGVDDTVTVFAASLAKVIPMYAAFELRARVRDALKTVPNSISPASAASLIQRAWQPQLDAERPSNAAAFKGFPRLTEILNIKKAGDGWTVDFQSNGNIGAIADPMDAHGAELDKIGYRENLKLMVTYSNDAAAERVIVPLSYEYINALLVTAGLYVPGSGGLWLGGAYWGNTKLWMAEPTMTETNDTRRYQVGTAKGFASIFAWIALGVLVDSGSSAEMSGMLDTRITEFIKPTLESDGRDVSFSRTKVGIQQGVYYWSETSLIQRTVGHKTIRYVVSIVNGDAHHLANTSFISPIDQCVLDRHP